MFLKLLFTPGICEADLKSTHSGEECNSPAVAELWVYSLYSWSPHTEYIRQEFEYPYVSVLLATRWLEEHADVN